MRRGLLVLVLLTVACSQGGQSAVKNTPTPVASAGESPAASPSPSDLPVSRVSFSCRLPISLSTAIATEPSESAFITFPSASVAIDPTGQGSGYFDRAYSRWLHVAREVVSPDGAHYAYVTMSPDQHLASGPRVDQGIFYVHVVDVASSSDHSFREDTNTAGIRFQPFVFDYASEGIYLSQGFYSFASDLWLVNPLTGSIRHVSNVGGLQVSAGGGVFWSGEVNPADPHPVASGTAAGNLPDQIDRLDLKTGSLTPWLYRPGYELAVVGLDIHGDPLIRAELGLVPPVQGVYDDPSASELLIALDATSQRLIYKGPLAGELYGAIADSHGVWFADLAWSNDASGRYGIYLYSDAGVLQRVSDQLGSPANGCF